MIPEDSLKFVKTLAWDDVFDLWRAGEATIPRWIEHYTKGGFSSWDDWRKNTLRDLPYEALPWKLFEVTDATRTVLQFFGGPFRVWIRAYYDGARTKAFRELATNPNVRDNAIVQQMIANFPAETNLVGLQRGNNIFIIEGTHRCCALAVMGSEGKSVPAKVLLALAPYPDEIPLMGRPDSPT